MKRTHRLSFGGDEDVGIGNSTGHGMSVLPDPPTYNTKVVRGSHLNGQKVPSIQAQGLLQPRASSWDTPQPFLGNKRQTHFKMHTRTEALLFQCHISFIAKHSCPSTPNSAGSSDLELLHAKALPQCSTSSPPALQHSYSNLARGLLLLDQVHPSSFF